MGVPLLDKNTGSVVDVNPDQVPAALKSGAFSFIKGRNVPVVMNGRETYVSPENAGRYIDDLRFTSEESVQQGIAERRTAGLGGAVEATALGLGKALTLGAGPALLGAVSETARERMRELELGRPNITAAAEFGGLLVDPFALAGRVGQRAALRGAEQLAAREAEQVAARAAVSPEIGAGQAAALFGPARQTPAGVAAQVAGEAAQVGRGAIGREVSPAIGAAQAGRRDVAAMTQEQLADFYASSGLPQGMDAYTALTARPSMRGLSRAEMMDRFNAAGGVDAGRKWADQMEAAWLRIAEQKPSGISAAGGDSMWFNFRVGKDVRPAAGAAREKAYITLTDPLSLSGGDVNGFLEALRKAKYNGQVKFPGSGARLITNFDNIVMHGATKADAELGEELARKFFGGRMEASSFGRDVAGKSHTQILADALEKRAQGKVLGQGGARAAAQEPGVSPLVLGARAAAPTAEEAARLTAEAEARRAAVGQSAVDRARGVAADEAGRVIEAESLRMRPLTGPTSPAEPGLRLGADPFRTEELAMRGRQAEELMARGQAARTAEARVAEEAAGMERGLQPGQVGPMEDFTRPPSEFLRAGDVRNQMANLEEALQANAAAASRARSEASRQRLAAERDRLLAQRDELEYTLFGAETRAEEAMATQAERALGAAEMQAGAPARALEAERMGRMAGEIEAANVLPPTLRTAETRVVSENVSPRLGIPAAPAPNVSPLGLGMAETGVMPAARGLALGAPIEARAAQAATDMTAAAAPGLIERIGRPALEGALYSGATQAYKQELGLEPGGAGEVLAATALGGVIGKGLSLGGKALVKGQKALTDAAAETAPESLAGMIGKAASGIERTHLLRQWGQTQKAVRKLNERFTEDELGKLGSTAMTDYIRNAAARIEELKAAHPENQFLQSINVGQKGLTFTNLSAEQRNAMAQVLREQAGKEVEAMYGPALNQVIDPRAIDAALKRVEKKLRTRGTGDIPLESIRAEMDALRASLRESYTVKELRDYEIATSRRFQEKRGVHEPLTEAQSLFRNEIKNVYLDAAEQVTPGLRQNLVVPNRNYTLADMLAIGADEALAKGETTSAVGRDSLAQFALGAFAMVQPVAATLFFLGTTALRGLYNQRGDGFIADMAGKLARKSASVAAAPEAAAREATQSILNAQRPLLGAFNAEKLVEVKPADYTSLSRGIRELAASTDFAHEKIRQATANLPPDQQERYIADYDATMQKLVDEMPKGIPTEKALSEAERRWTVMARSLFDHAYATQTIANGGPMATAAAQGLTMIPNGQKYLDELATNLQRAIAENEKLRGNQQLATVVRNLSKVKTGGGGIRIQRIVSGMGQQAFQPPAGGRLPTPGASGQAAARNSLGGVYATPR